MLTVGQDNKLYYNSATNASPTWVLIDKVGDVTLSMSISEAEVDLRVTDYLLGLPAKISASLNLNLASDPGGTVHDALRTAALARTAKQMAVASGAIATSGTQYFKAFMHFTEFPWAQETQSLSRREATMKLTYAEESAAAVYPSWVTVA